MADTPPTTPSTPTSLTSKPRVYLFTHPRTASNVFIKILNLPAQNINPATHGGYFFFDPVLKAIECKAIGKPPTTWTTEQAVMLKQSFQDGFEHFEKWIENGEKQGKVIFVKEHAVFMNDPISQYEFLSKSKNQPTGSLPEQWQIHIAGLDGKKISPSAHNKTILPDSVLLTFLPTFLIRHPALAFPSNYRAYSDEQLKGTSKVRDETPEEKSMLAAVECWMTFHWQRELYEFYTTNPAFEYKYQGVNFPLVLEADDNLTKLEVVIKYADLVGLDKDKLKWEWSPFTQEELEKIPAGRRRRYLDTLAASRGTVSGKTSEGIDISGEAAKWRIEFGEVVGKAMEKWVRDAMEDYEFLRERRLRV